MGDIKIRTCNLEEAIKALTYGFRFKLAIIIVMALIVINGDAELEKNTSVPFIDLEAPSIWVAFVSLFLYLIAGCSMLHSYKMLRRNLTMLKKEADADDFNSIIDHPAWWISGNKVTQGLVIVLTAFIFAAVLVQTWPKQNWTETIIVPLIFSIPYFMLAFRIWKDKI